MSIDVGSAVGYLMLDTSGFQKGFDSAFKDMESFLDKTNKSNDKLKAFGSATTKVGTAFTKYLTTPLLGAGTAFTAFAADSQEALAEFSSKAGIATEDAKEYESVLQSIYKNNYGESYEDIADAMGDVVIALGEMDPSNMQEVTESAIALRDVYGYEVPESLRTVDTLMKNFGFTAEQAFDYIVKGQQEGLDFSGEFLDTINEYSVQFKKLGFDANDMFAILKEGADSGAWNLDKIGDAIKEFSIRAIDGSDTTVAGFEAIGLSADEMSQKFGQGGDVAKEAFGQVIQALSDMEDPVQQNIAGVNLFGTMWEDLGPTVIEQLNNITSASVDTTGAMKELKEVKYDNLKSAMEGLGRSIQVAGASLGKYFIPFVQLAIDLVQGWTDKFNSLSESTKQVVVIIGTIVAAIGPILLIIGKLITGISSIMTVMSTLSGLSAILAPVGTVLSGFVAPIAAILAAIGILVVAWQTDFNGMRDTVATWASTIQAVIQNVLTIIQTVISTALGLITMAWSTNFANIQGIVTAAFNYVQDNITNVLNIIKSLLDVWVALFTGDWQGFLTAISNLWTSIWTGIRDFVANMLNLIIQIIIGVAGGFVDAVMTVLSAAKVAFESGWRAITDWFSQAVEDPVGTILGIGEALYNAGKDIFGKLLDGIKSVWDEISGFVSDSVNWLIDRITFWNNESSRISTSSIGSGRSVQGSYASGIDYIPRDMNVRVHEGEAILTKEENKERSGSGKLTVEVPLFINGKKVARAIAKDIDVELGKKKG